jgi:hypothetical protein
VLLTWVFNLLSLVFLYFDAIRKLLNYIETLRLNRLNRLRITRLIKISEQNRPIRHRRLLP